jgi:hypothetical protein
MQRIIDDRGKIATRNPSSAGLAQDLGLGRCDAAVAGASPPSDSNLWAGCKFLPCDKYFKHFDGQDFQDNYETQ